LSPLPKKIWEGGIEVRKRKPQVVSLRLSFSRYTHLK
jgi:hypothetical protein